MSIRVANPWLPQKIALEDVEGQDFVVIVRGREVYSIVRREVGCCCPGGGWLHEMLPFLRRSTGHCEVVTG